MEFIDNVYVINMNKSTDRLLHMQNEIKKLKKSFIRISAIDGSELSYYKKYKHCSFFGKHFLTPSIIGCFLSHKKTWKTMLKNKDSYALILEDDCYLLDSFNDDLYLAIKELNKKDPNWEFLYTGCFGPHGGHKNTFVTFLQEMFLDKIPQSNNKFNAKYNYIPVSPVGFHSYIISRSCAKKLLKYLKNISYHVDVDFLKYSKHFNVYATKKKIGYQCSTAENSNLTSKYPILLNKIFTNIVDDNNIAYSYYLGLPIINILDFYVNLYFVIFILLTLFFSFFKIKHLFSLIILSYLSYELYLDSKNINTIIIWISILYILNKRFIH